MKLLLAGEAVKHRRPLAKLSLTVLVAMLLVGFLLVRVVLGVTAGLMAQARNPLLVVDQTCSSAPTDTAGQLRNVGIIAQVGRSMGVSDAGLVIAVGTTLVESGGLNVASRAVPESANYPNDGVRPGDHDSVGLFQQRSNWGTVAERMDPATSARKFFEGLFLVNGWESMAPGDAAQAVQHSGTPGAYGPRMAEAATLLAGAPAVKPCTAPAPGPGAGNGFLDGAGQPLPRPNPRSVQEAIAWARAEAASGNSIWYRRCLSFVAIAYGWHVSGIPYAIDKFSDVPPQFQHPGDMNPEPGALMFWTTGSRAGHVALYLGGGQLASNDILVDGQISIVPATLISEKWGAHYVGWTEPLFPHGG